MLGWAYAGVVGASLGVNWLALVSRMLKSLWAFVSDKLKKTKIFKARIKKEDSSNDKKMRMSLQKLNDISQMEGEDIKEELKTVQNEMQRQIMETKLILIQMNAKFSN